MKLLKSLAMMIFLLFAHESVFASFGVMGSDAFLTTYACRFTYTGDCVVAITPEFPGGEMGNKLTIVGTTDSMINLYASAYASSGFVNDLLLPVLKASAGDGGRSPSLSNPDPLKYSGKTATIADANVWAVSHYRYNGVRPTQLALTASAQTRFLPTNDLMGHSHMQIGVFTSSDYRFDIDGICPIGGFTHCDLKNTTTLGSVGVYLDPSVHANILTIYYNVKPGDEFYVGAMLDANVCCGGSVDTAHTMNLLFSDTSQLELLTVPGTFVSDVPEPKTYSLLISDLLFLGAANRMKIRLFHRNVFGIKKFSRKSSDDILRRRFFRGPTYRHNQR